MQILRVLTIILVLTLSWGEQITNPLGDGDVENDILRIFGKPKNNPSFQGCETSAYPPTNVLPPPSEYVINLDLPPEYRWVKVAQDKAQYISNMLQSLKNYTKPFFNGRLFDYVNELMPILGKTLPSPFREEIEGMSKITGIPLGELFLYNVFYELFTVCTSIVAQDSNGLMWHGRNLDFGLFLGWDTENATWLTTEYLRPLVIHLTFVRGNQTVFQAVNFAGYTGILTGLKKDAFSLSVNERFNLKGGFVGILQWLLGKKDIMWMGFLTRQVMENATSYKTAQKMLLKTPLLAPAYFILSGSKPGQGSIITRGQNQGDLLAIGDKVQNASTSWFLVQTNYDHWKQPPFWDDRRGPAVTCMEQTGDSSLTQGFKSLYNVLSTKPVLNKLTTYTTLMQVNTGKMEVYIRDCLTPCWPW